MDEISAWSFSRTLKPLIKAGNFQEPYELLVQKMREAGPNPFDIVIGLKFTNDPESIAATFDEFVDKYCPADRIKFIYTEMNGFTINPDLWFFDPFGFDDIGHSETEDFGEFMCWSDAGGTVLTGMEDLQMAYADRSGYENERDLAAFIVILNFQQLMQKSTPLMRWRNLPIYADGHDHDFAARVN